MCWVVFCLNASVNVLYNPPLPYSLCAMKVSPVDIVKWLHGNRMSTVQSNCSAWVTLGVPVAVTTKPVCTIECAHLMWNWSAVNAPARRQQSAQGAGSLAVSLCSSADLWHSKWLLQKIQNSSLEIQFRYSPVVRLLPEASILAVPWRESGIYHGEVTSPKAGSLSHHKELKNDIILP